MPLAFDSRSHGTIPFGFFQIESSMLLLRRWFFFAEDFCSAVVELAGRSAAELDGWVIEDPAQLGDLHGAIAGVDLSGFIGATYARFPFPAERAEFKQNPRGRMPRAEAEQLIADHGAPLRLKLAARAEELHIGPHGDAAPLRFTPDQFGELVRYVDRGGMPRWRDGRRPDYVAQMMTRLAELSPAFAP